MAGIFHRSRGGVRGGQDQFKWEDVKTDKHRQCYLGNSEKVPTGRWQKGRDILWYTRNRDGANTEEARVRMLDGERARARKEEEELMMEHLGLKPWRDRRTVEHERLSKGELEEVCARGETECPENSGERIEGLGYSEAPHHDENFRLKDAYPRIRNPVHSQWDPGF
eukprot:671266_1